jgi:uncharacterized membrane protein
MKMTLCSSLSAALLLSACAKYDAANNSAENQATQPLPTNAMVESSPSPVPNEVAPTPTSTPESAPPERKPAPAEKIAYRALGTEPFWSVTVRQGRATLERPDRPALTVPVTLTEDPRALRYVDEGLTLLVTPGPCSDGMSDIVYADRTQVAFGEGTLKGCGGPRINDEPDHEP